MQRYIYPDVARNILKTLLDAQKAGKTLMSDDPILARWRGGASWNRLQQDGHLRFRRDGAVYATESGQQWYERSLCSTE